MTEYLHKDAALSADGRFRYRLERRWGPPGSVLVCVGLNPSTADALEDDPTIRVLVGLARREGYSSLLMLNLYAYRAAEPDDLHLQIALGNDVQGSNQRWLETHAMTYGRAVAVWGAGAPYARQREVAALFPRLKCLGVNRDGSPWHPLRKSLTGLWPWSPALLPL